MVGIDTNKMDLLFPRIEDIKADISPLTDIHAGVHMEQVDRCPVTGRIIPPLDVMVRSMEGFVRVSGPAHMQEEAVIGVAKQVRSRALRSGIPSAVQYFEYLSDYTMAGENNQSGNNQRRDGSDGSGDQFIHEGVGVRSGVIELPRGPNPQGGEGHSDRGTDGPDEGGEVIALPSRRGAHRGLSRKVVEEELEEHRKDLDAFSGSYALIKNRVREVKDEGRLMKLVEWSGTAAVMGSLELSIHAIERVLDELKDLLKRIDAGAIPNLDEDGHV